MYLSDSPNFYLLPKIESCHIRFIVSLCFRVSIPGIAKRESGKSQSLSNNSCIMTKELYPRRPSSKGRQN